MDSTFSYAFAFNVVLLSLVFFLTNLSPFCCSPLTATSRHEKEETPDDYYYNYFQKWISWNMEDYRRKKTAEDQDSIKLISNINVGKVGAVDSNLMAAEMNRSRLIVSQDGAGDFKTIKEAVDSIPLHNTRRVILDIKPGLYREKINIPKGMGFITFLGNWSDPPTVTGNDTAAATGRDGLPFRTFQSATVAIDADYFVAININFENTAGHVVGSVGGQGVAVRISGTKAAFYNCSFYGSQDTLYDHKGLHYFNNCFIQGSVDFIFGYARSLYENCKLNSVAKKVASVTAQKRTNSSMGSGFSFKNCSITGSGTVYLGRAWGDYSRVVFSYTYMDKLVIPQGWSDWGQINRERTVYFGEYKCSGVGASLSGRVGWARSLTDQEAIPFIGTYYVDGDSWLIYN
ncbi:hypothetical protein ACH5RR_019940 [Cinchona calisaya]|uniref:Pectinesterase n=1 Tax=Cinchona calisaya TaxID=153742 RepID=A0ABD2ZD12_9GENT